MKKIVVFFVLAVLSCTAFSQMWLSPSGSLTPYVTPGSVPIGGGSSIRRVQSQNLIYAKMPVTEWKEWDERITIDAEPGNYIWLRIDFGDMVEFVNVLRIRAGDGWFGRYMVVDFTTEETSRTFSMKRIERPIMYCEYIEAAYLVESTGGE